MQLGHPRDVHEDAAIDAQEGPGIEPALELGQRDVEHVLRARGHRIRRAVPGQHVRDVADGDQLHAVARARGEMIEKRRRAELLRQAAQRLADVVVGPAAPRGDAVQRSIEPRALDRLEQVVEGVDLERAQGVLVVGRREHDHRARRDALDHLEAAEPGHMDVEKQHVDGYRGHRC